MTAVTTITTSIPSIRPAPTAAPARSLTAMKRGRLGVASSDRAIVP